LPSEPAALLRIKHGQPPLERRWLDVRIVSRASGACHDAAIVHVQD